MESPAGKPRFSITEGKLVMTWPDGRRRTRHPIWLRERLPDPRVLVPLNGQRLIVAAELPLDLSVTRADAAGGRIAIAFSDGFEAAIPEAWFYGPDEPRASRDSDAAVVFWDGRLEPLPQARFGEIRASETALAAFLDALHSHGFAIVRDVPVHADGALEFAGVIGPIRLTNWGGLADVKADPGSPDLSLKPRGMEPHTDNPWRSPVPGYVLLHCLANDAEGGESTVVDGFHAAELLRARDPASFEALTRTRVDFRYADESALLEDRGPLIELDGEGRVVQVRFSTLTEQVEALAVPELDAYYRGRGAFYRLISGQELTRAFKLRPGDLLMLNNFRVIHGRAPFRLETGSRLLRHCFMDHDTVRNRRAVLNRRLRAA